MVWRPPWCLGQHAESLKHEATWQCIVSSAGARKGTVQVGIDQERMRFSSIRSIGDANDNVGNVAIGFVQSFTHHIKAWVEPDQPLVKITQSMTTYRCDPLPDCLQTSHSKPVGHCSAIS